MAKFKCSDGIYTVLRNGKAVATGATAGEAIVAITADAAETTIDCCSIRVTGMAAVEGGVEFTLDISGTHMNLCYDYDSGAEVGCTGCQLKTGTINGGAAAAFIADINPLELTFYSSTDGCLTYCDEYVLSKYTREVTVLTVGAATVAAVPVGTPACVDLVISYAEVFTTLVGATLNTTTGAVTIPAQVLVDPAIYVYLKYCDALLTGILVIQVTNP